QAVKAGNLDEQGRDDLIAAVAGRRPRRDRQASAAAPASPNRATIMERLFMFVGWMAFLVGGALLTFGLSTTGRDTDDFMLGGIIVGLVGFGLLTYPFVIRELESRGARSVAR
ncbi:MAG: hypothetical protein V3U11_10355, partial [Planctomycetota bacterium]